MRYRIRKDSTESAYLQLYHQLKEDIAERVLPYGTKLPSKRLMAEEAGTSVITVEHSYELLQDEGYIEAHPRSGFYVSFDSSFAEAEPYEGYDTAESGAGSGAISAKADAFQPDEASFHGKETPEPITEATEDFPFSVLARVMRSVLSARGRDILAKSPNSGLTVLRETLSQYLLRSRGIRISASQIVIGSGAEYLYGLVVELLGKERTYAREEPCYDRIREIYRAKDVTSEGLVLGKNGIRRAELQRCSADVLHVTPWSSYPSGITASAAKRREYVAWARAHDSIIIEDDYDSEFASPTRQIETLYSLAPERVIYINTFTKTLAPSMRMGYMVLPVRLLPLFVEKLGFYTCTVPVFEQYVLEEFIREGHLERYINARRRKLRK